ncbi:4Fe-4S binding protein [Blautia sp.]|uniref:4Fe-4S binding protein n=1 Tax=Blautia sp. TaxID=1955243 RepID=UPI003AF62616
MSYIYNKSWKLQFSASSSIIIIEDFYLQTFLHSLSETDKSKCISCMRCVSICPVHARKVSQLMTSVAAAALKKTCSVEKENELFI